MIVEVIIGKRLRPQILFFFFFVFLKKFFCCFLPVKREKDERKYGRDGVCFIHIAIWFRYLGNSV